MVMQNWQQMVHLICFGTINGILFAVTTFGMTIMVSMLSVENLDSARVQGGSRTLITAKMLSKLGHVGLERTLHLALGNRTSTEWTPTADLVREIMLLLLHVLEILRELKKIAAQVKLKLKCNYHRIMNFMKFNYDFQHDCEFMIFHIFQIFLLLPFLKQQRRRVRIDEFRVSFH